MVVSVRWKQNKEKNKEKDEEILMCYTCYPFNNIGYATQRYVVYAKPV